MKKVEDKEELEVVQISEIKNYEASVLMQVYGKMFNADFSKDEFDDALVIAEEGVVIEDSMKAYAKLEKAILEKAEKMRDKEGKIPVALVDKTNADLQELSGKIVKLSKPLSDSIKKHINKINVKPKEIRVLRELKLI